MDYVCSVIDRLAMIGHDSSPVIVYLLAAMCLKLGRYVARLVHAEPYWHTNSGQVRCISIEWFSLPLHLQFS